MEAMLDAGLQFTMDELKKRGLFNMPVMVAVDKHKVARYDHDNDHGYLAGGKHERGTSRYEIYITAQCVEEGMRAQLACQHVKALDDNADLMTSLLNDVRLNEIDVSLLLMDREFFSTSVVLRLNKLNQPFLMPCVRRKGIIEALREFSSGRRGSASNYTMRGADGTADIRLVVVPGADGRPLPFATNLPEDRVLWNLYIIPKEYRRRWGIETGYIGVEELRARTTSRNHSLRLLLFYYGQILYNIWLLINLMIAEEFFRRLKTSMMHLAVLKGLLHSFIVKGFSGG